MNILPADQRASEEASEAIACTGCGSSEFVDLGHAPAQAVGRRASAYERDLAQKYDSFRIRRCRKCYLVFRSPQVTDDELVELYASLPAMRWKKRFENVGVVELASQYLQREFHGCKSPSILDVGAYDGKFLDILPKHWRKAAIEPSTEACRILADAGVEVVGEFLRPDDAPLDLSKRFDVVTLFDVFEHLTTPTACVRSAFSMCGLEGNS